MAMLTIRNLPEDVRRALRVRAALHGRSAEAEVRAILQEAVKPKDPVKLGSLLADIGRRVGLKDEEFAGFELRDKSGARPVDLK